MRINYNHVYYFRYSAIGEGELNVYDKTPLIFVLDIRPDSILGLNMHWINKKDRIELYGNIMEIMAKTTGSGKKKERLRLTYQMLRQPKFMAGMQGIRMYYAKGMTQVKEFKPEQMAVILGTYGRYFELRMRKVYKSSKYKD
jgi:hypothetical protein